jgi:hypothetical protein
MSPALLVLRAVVSVLAFGLLSLYVWRRLVRDTGLTGWGRRAATAALLATQLPMLVVALSSAQSPTVQGWLAWPTYVGWALFGLTFAYLLLIDLARLAVRGARRLARRPAPLDPSRRQALARLTGGVVTTAVAGQVAFGAREALALPAVVEEEFTLPRLPPGLDGFCLVQLTDLHVGMTTDRERVAALVRAANAAGGDAIVLTGDLVDGSVDELADAVAPLAELRAPHGVYAVTGNHEYYSGGPAWVAKLTALGVRVLRNERVSIERDGAAFDLAGIDDHSARKFARGHGPDLDAALAGRDPARALVLLAHQPRQVHAAARRDVDLQLSGHTHGGQVWPWHYLAAAQQGGLLAGRYQVGDTRLYVSRGTGYWGPPVRLGAPAEITRVVLRAPTSA